MLWGAGALLVLALSAASTSTAQTGKTETATGTSTSKASGQPGPAWATLPALQRQALAPLAATWDSLSAGQQRKWLEVSRNYPALALDDQTKMHRRMSAWVALSARERSAARLNFAATTEIAKALSAQEKKAKWDAYQALSVDERQKLANRASRPPAGAAPATRPVAAQKLAVLPSTSNAAGAARPPKMSGAANEASTAAVPGDRTER